MHDNQHRIQQSLWPQRAKRPPRKNVGAAQTAAFGASFAAALLLTLTAAAHESTVALSGTVHDADGKSAADAAVIVAGGPEVFRIWRDRTRGVNAPVPLGEAASDASGKFNVPLPAEAAEYGGRRSRLSVWTYHPGDAVGVRLIDRDWLPAGLPLPLTVGRASPLRLKVVGDDWRPIAHARIMPYRVAVQIVPLALAERLAVTTDAKGIVELTGFARDELDAVQVEHEVCGIQLLGIPRAEMDATAIVTLAPVGRLAGRLMADDASAIRGRKLRFTTWRVPDDAAMGLGVADVVTDAEGKFDVPAIAAGNLTFEIDRGPEDTGRVGIAHRGLMVGNAHPTPVYLRVESTGPQLEPHTTTNFEIPLRRATLVTQEVRDRDDGTPIADVVVSFNWAETNDVQAITDATGKCRAYLLPGMYTPRGSRLPPPYYHPSPLLGLEAVPEDSQEVTFRPMRLARGATVRGRVVDAAGNPVAGAQIAGSWPVPPQFTGAAYAWTNAAGEFSINAVPKEVDVRLWARREEALTVEPVLTRANGDPATLTVREGSSVSLDGRVVAVTGHPVAGARARIRAEASERDSNEHPTIGALIVDGRDYLATDAEGRFRTPRWLRPDLAYTLEVEAPGMLPVKTEAIVPRLWQTTHFADVVLHPAPRLRAIAGRVIDSGGNAIAGATVFQSGDGPRRSETTADAEGRFVLRDLYDGPAYLFARKDGFRMRGVRAAPEADTCEIVLSRADEPATAMTTRPPSLPLEERRRLAMSLLEPMLPILREPVFNQEHFGVLNAVTQCDPNRALEIADQVLTNPELISQVRWSAATAQVETNLDEALAAIALVNDPWRRARAYLDAWDRLNDKPRGETDRLLNEVLLTARAVADVGRKLELLGRIAERWLDLGETERGTALLREGQTLAAALPSPGKGIDFSQGMFFKAMFAGPLARIDGPAAIALTEGFERPRNDWFHAAAARGLAEHDAAEAERMLNLLELPNLRFGYGLTVLHRMAAIDPERAARLARGFPDTRQQGYALGTVAHRLADVDRAAAARLLDEAYTTLERSSDELKRFDGMSAASSAAGLLPVAEKIDPHLVEGYFWRAMALRRPRGVEGDIAHVDNRDLASFAALVARYDPAVARDVARPFAARMRELAAEAQSGSPQVSDRVFMALAVSDARLAYDLVQSLPDSPVKPGLNPKQTAARLVAKWLGYPPRELWRVVYNRCTQRNPDARDEDR